MTKHWLMVVDPDTRRMADHYATLRGDHYPQRSVQGEAIDYSLAHDVEKITEEPIKVLAVIDLMCCA